MTDAEKIAAVDVLLDCMLQCDAHPHNKAARGRLNAAIAVVLTEMLGRKPTAQEIADACK